MTTMPHRWRARRWSPPDFFEQLRVEGEIECIDELVRSFTYFATARLQLLSDERTWNEQETPEELQKLKDSCRQVGADRMAFLCGEVQKQSSNNHTDAFRYLMEALREEGYGTLHDMRNYTIGLKSRAMSAAASAIPRRSADSAIWSRDRQNNVIGFTAMAELRQRISRAAHVARLMPVEISSKKM